MDKRNYAFGKINFILMVVGMLIVILGFILMSGGGSDEHVFDNDIFSVRRVKVAPAVCFLGFISIIYAIKKKKKDVRILLLHLRIKIVVRLKQCFLKKQ